MAFAELSTETCYNQHSRYPCLYDYKLEYEEDVENHRDLEFRLLHMRHGIESINELYGFCNIVDSYSNYNYNAERLSTYISFNKKLKEPDCIKLDKEKIISNFNNKDKLLSDMIIIL